MTTTNTSVVDVCLRCRDGFRPDGECPFCAGSGTRAASPVRPLPRPFPDEARPRVRRALMPHLIETGPGSASSRARLIVSTLRLDASPRLAIRALEGAGLEGEHVRAAAFDLAAALEDYAREIRGTRLVHRRAATLRRWAGQLREVAR